MRHRLPLPPSTRCWQVYQRRKKKVRTYRLHKKKGSRPVFRSMRGERGTRAVYIKRQVACWLHTIRLPILRDFVPQICASLFGSSFLQSPGSLDHLHEALSWQHHFNFFSEQILSDVLPAQKTHMSLTHRL